MTIEQFEQASPIVQDLQKAKTELAQVEELMSEITGQAKVKVNTRWQFNLPAASMKGQAQKRKTELEQEISDLTQQLSEI